MRPGIRRGSSEIPIPVQRHRGGDMKNGIRNGRLVAIQKTTEKSSDGHYLWLCKCDCGNTKKIASNLLRPTGTKSCGCLRSEAQRKRIKRDGVWNDGKSYSINGGRRCYKTRHSWAKAAIKKYGNKCERCGWNASRCDVHHRVKKSDGGLHTLDNAIVLCPNCHRIEHEGRI